MTRAGTLRLLYYNWVDNLDPARRGGGVRTYQRNLMEDLARRDGIEALFLSSGLAHDLRSRAPRWAPVGNDNQRFEILNARPNAPSHHSFGDPAQIAHPETEAAFADFVARNGPFDAIHFNNLEGLPARVLALKEALPDTRFVLSLHNYYPFCPQVNLWQQEARHCDNFEGGRACVNCLPFRHDPGRIRAANALSSTLDRAGLGRGTPLRDRIVSPALRNAGRAARLAARLRKPGTTGPGPAPAEAGKGRAFARRRAEFVRLINTWCDSVLCVSDRTAGIARSFGIDAELVRTSYIGSDHADRFASTAPKPGLPRADGSLRMAYLGYARRDKGFFFLLDALDALPDALARRLKLTLAAAGVDAATRARLRGMAARFSALDHVDGYDRDSLDTLLEDVDLGVVPVLWEDNLPQVAIEMHARHIPLLTSDRGGAQELGNCPAMVFAAGDTAQFAERLGAILGGGVDLGGYWAGARPPPDVAGHVDALLAEYRA